MVFYIAAHSGEVTLQANTKKTSLYITIKEVFVIFLYQKRNENHKYNTDGRGQPSDEDDRLLHIPLDNGVLYERNHKNELGTCYRTIHT